MSVSFKFCPGCGRPINNTYDNFCGSCGFNFSAAIAELESHLQSKNQSSEKISFSTKESHKVAGTSYRQSAIKSLGFENDDYSLSKRDLEDSCSEYEKIYQFEFFPSNVQLVEEPENEYDPNAIKVVIDGVHVGYIKKGSCSHVKKLINENKILSISADISGGKYKMLVPNDDDYDSFRLDRGSSDFFITVYLEVIK